MIFEGEGQAPQSKPEAGRWSRMQILSTDAVPEDDYLGLSVAMDTDSAVIGCAVSTDSVAPPGAANLFRDTGNEWQHDQRLYIDDPPSDMLFGWSVALDGRDAIVGMKNLADNPDTTPGRAYHYNRKADEWSQTGVLSPTAVAPGDRFGHAVALDDQTAFVGAPKASKTGTVFVFTRDDDGWQESVQLTSEEGTTRDFGQAVALDGKHAVSLASHLGRSAAVYMYEAVGGDWQQQQGFILGGKPASAVNKSAVDISGDRAIVAQETELGDSSPELIAYLFRRTPEGWTQEQRLSIQGDSNESLDVGTSAAIAGDQALIASTAFIENDAGAAYFLEYDGSDWQVTASVTPQSSGSFFGYVADMTSDTAMVGNPGDVSVYQHAERAGPPNSAPIARFAVVPPQPTAGKPATVDASVSSDPDEDIVRYEWDIDNDGQYEQQGQQIRITFPSPGQTEVRLRVVDEHGAVTTTSQTIEVTQSTQSRPTTVTQRRSQLQQGTTLPVDIGSTRLFVIHDIPKTDSWRRAVTTREYELVDLSTTRDALYAAEWTRNWESIPDYSQQLTEAKQKVTEFRRLQLWSRAASLGVQAFETFALAHFHPSLAIDAAIDLCIESVNWAWDEATSPYKEGFQKITRTLIDCRAFNQRAQRIHTRDNFDDKLANFLSTSLKIVKFGRDIGVNWGTTVAQHGLNTGLTKSLAKSAGSTTLVTFVGLAIDQAVEQLVAAPLEINAKIMGAARAHTAAVIPILRNLIELEARRENAQLGPGGIVALQRQKMGVAQATALLAALTSKYYEEMSSLHTGFLYDVVTGAGQKATEHKQLSADMRDLAKLHYRALGQGTQRVHNDLERSLNRQWYAGEL